MGLLPLKPRDHRRVTVRLVMFNMVMLEGADGGSGRFAVGG